MKLTLAGLTWLLLICSFTPVSAQNDELPVISRAERLIEDKEPGWQLIRGVCNCPTFMAGQKSVSVESWVRQSKRGVRESIEIEFYEVATLEDAAKWMQHYEKGDVAEGWQVKKYELGDEAYILSYREGSRTSICFRKDKIIVEVSSASSEDVERFAKYVLEAMR